MSAGIYRTYTWSYLLWESSDHLLFFATVKQRQSKTVFKGLWKPPMRFWLIDLVHVCAGDPYREVPTHRPVLDAVQEKMRSPMY